MLQEVMWAYCDQFHVVFVLPALWCYDQQKSEVGRDRDWEEWDSGCHRTSDSDSSSNFDVHNMCLDMVNIFGVTIVACRPIWKWSVSSILWASWLLKFRTACFDMKDDRSKRSGLICVRWNALLEVASDLGANSYSKKKSFTWFPTSCDQVESTALLRDMKKKGREEAEDRDFWLLYPRKVCKRRWSRQVTF